MVSFQKLKIYGLEIRRQHTIESFTVDFYIDELKIIIEVDGGVHDNLGQSNYDHARDQLLKSKGFQTIRIDNQSVTDYTDSALMWIKQEIELLKNK